MELERDRRATGAAEVAGAREIDNLVGAGRYEDVPALVEACRELVLLEERDGVSAGGKTGREVFYGAVRAAPR